MIFPQRATVTVVLLGLVGSGCSRGRGCSIVDTVACVIVAMVVECLECLSMCLLVFGTSVGVLVPLLPPIDTSRCTAELPVMDFRLVVGGLVRGTLRIPIVQHASVVPECEYVGLCT